MLESQSVCQLVTHDTGQLSFVLHNDSQEAAASWCCNITGISRIRRRQPFTSTRMLIMVSLISVAIIQHRQAALFCRKRSQSAQQLFSLSVGFIAFSRSAAACGTCSVQESAYSLRYHSGGQKCRAKGATQIPYQVRGII